ncbi:MAG TPA: glycosyltransferase family 2 protein [Pyrinomonadaceae bacterium]|nr:glycosyltransferase family 2 protein [Pyrinomonadaceae bacterium]
MNPPFFSIILPTRNRAEYLPSAIQTVLNQTFTDFELIVSNNCSSDKTEEIILSFKDSRIKYFKPNESLSLDEHFEFATEKASGKYFTYLGDDDAYSHIYLESLAKIIDEHKAEIVTCRMGDYYYAATDERYGLKVKADSMLTFPFDNKLSIYDAKDAIKNIYAHVGLTLNAETKGFQSPQLINTAYNQRLFETIKKRRGKVFPDVLSNDYFLAILTLNLTDNYYFLDSPLSLHGFSPVSASISVGKNSVESVSEKDKVLISRIKKSPLKLLSPFNLVADALLLAKDELGAKLDFIEIDFTNYIKTAAAIIQHRELEGANVAQDKKELEKLIALQTDETKKILKNDLLHWRTKLKDNIRKKIYGSTIYDFLRKRNSAPISEQIIIEGKSAGFSNIAECGKAINKEFLEKFSVKKF